MRLDHRLVIAILICSAACAAAQDTSQNANQDARERKTPDTTEKTAPGGTVTGHAFLDDTKSPARKAEVYLAPVASLQSDDPPDRGNKGNPSVAVQAQFDGSFTFSHVTAGSYYLLATSPGYVSPFVTLSLAERR